MRRPRFRRPPRSSVLRTLVLGLAVLVTLLAAGPAAAERRSISASAERGHEVVFGLSDLRPAQIRRAEVRLGDHQHRLATRRVRRAAKQGELRVRPSRSVWRRLRQPVSGASGRATGIRRLRLTLAVMPEPTRPGVPVSGPLGGFEAGLEEFDGSSMTSGALALSSDRAYDGGHSARVSYDGSGDNGFARTWFAVDWGSGSDVWYGGAYYIPAGAPMPCWYSILRWDNYRLFGGDGDVGGIEINSNGRAQLMRADYDGGNYAALTRDFELPRGRWFWIEVHQRLSKHDGQALNEVYLDGRRLDASARANSRGRGVTEVRHGLVAVAGECSPPSTFFFDRPSASDGMRGPVS